MMRRTLLAWVSWMLFGVVASVGCSPSTLLGTASPDAQSSNEAIALTISAAASLQDAMSMIQLVYEEANPGVTLTYNFGSSGSLQQQIEQGAPVDIFLSASPKQMDALEKKDLLLEGTRTELLKNSIVLVTPADKATVSGFEDLDKETVHRLSIGEPDSVPAGQYGKETLESLGLYDTVQSKIVFAKDVRQVLTYVETGNVEAGLVYSSDAERSEQVQIVAVAPDGSHAPIVYPGAVLIDSANPDGAATFLDFLGTAEAIAIFENFGFLPAS